MGIILEALEGALTHFGPELCRPAGFIFGVTTDAAPEAVWTAIGTRIKADATFDQPVSAYLTGSRTVFDVSHAAIQRRWDHLALWWDTPEADEPDGEVAADLYRRYQAVQRHLLDSMYMVSLLCNAISACN